MPRATATAASYVNRALDALARDIENRKCLGSADPKHDPALFFEVARQALQRAMRGAVTEYGISPEKARTLTRNAMAQVVDGLSLAVRPKGEREADHRDALSRAECVGSASDVDLFAATHGSARRGRRVAPKEPGE